MKISDRILSMQASPIRKLVPFSDEAKKNGKKVYHLNIGQPDIKTPRLFFETVKNYDTDVLAYTHSQGLRSLIDSFVEYYNGWGLNFEERDILITNGGSEAILFALLATCDQNDEFLVPEPFYANYNSIGEMAGAIAVPIVTKADNGFALPDIAELQKLVTPKTRAILINNPSNPTGKVYDSSEITNIMQLALNNDLFIISDEVYREFVYDGLEVFSFGSIKEIEDRVILIDSISKRYSACGARIGCIASRNNMIIKQMLKLCQARLCVPTLEQVGASELFNMNKSDLEKIRTEYDYRRKIVYSALKEMKGVFCKMPQGAFYIMAKLPVENAENFAKWLLTDFEINGETVMIAPAEGFYVTEGRGKDEVRISYVLNAKDLEKAMAILDAGLRRYHALQ
ncbi:MAG: pyridoxal phosphate-dependent aminotransferase [Tissierellales bacterium]|nr:pyridoxal phosphate-dependent aminotransferase [Tissierellales bacterium]MBN2826845.1 pyridoxal phosphate-dependent aminotransferase [Tissierellales bacterium]